MSRVIMKVAVDGYFPPAVPPIPSIDYLGKPVSVQIGCHVLRVVNDFQLLIRPSVSIFRTLGKGKLTILLTWPNKDSLGGVKKRKKIIIFRPGCEYEGIVVQSKLA